jgi:nucleotide-binding universal stress UspA family protein
MHLIMVATDGSASSDRAVDIAAGLARAGGCKLQIVTVENSVIERSKGIDMMAQVEGSLGEAIEAAANIVLQQANERARQHGAASVETQWYWGDPSEAIIEAARNMKADLIVVGRRGRGRLTGLLLGSVSQKLVSLAPCAVMVVP